MSGALLPESMVDAQPGKLLYIYALHYGFILIAFFAFIASSIDLITRTYRTYTGLKKLSCLGKALVFGSATGMILCAIALLLLLAYQIWIADDD